MGVKRIRNDAVDPQELNPSEALDAAFGDEIGQSDVEFHSRVRNMQKTRREISAARQAVARTESVSNEGVSDE